MPFACSICEQESTRICAFCTKDACDNHLCERCGSCSDCCECEVPLDDVAVHPHHVPVVEAEPAVTADPLASLDPEASPEPAIQLETSLPVFEPLPAEPPETPEV
jgi:hypothetical protein